MSIRATIAAVALMVTANAAVADDLIGRASVIDGDTIEIRGERVRLHGVDAPESRQLCQDAGGKEYRCGQKAALALADWLDGAQPIRCHPLSQDRYGRTVARCSRSGEDVGAWLARSGLALDWPRYSGGEYASAQAEAKRAGRGVWQGTFDLPWEWRRK